MGTHIYTVIKYQPIASALCAGNGSHPWKLVLFGMLDGGQSPETP
jgi:hypothetical protein